jgi:DDE family transposase
MQRLVDLVTRDWRRLIAMGTPASRRTIRGLLKKLKLGRRTARNKKTMGQNPDRNAQFENIARLREEYEAAGDPVISIDTKKKEQLGNFHRPGQTYTEQTVVTFDHDFPSAGDGKLIPHSIYDSCSILRSFNCSARSGRPLGRSKAFSAWQDMSFGESATPSAWEDEYRRSG